MKTIKKYSLWILAYLILFSCNTNRIASNCEGLLNIKGIALYQNNVDEAIKCSKEMNIPILIHFTNWSKSQNTFYDKIIVDSKVKKHLKNDLLLLDLMCDDKHITEIGNYSKILKKIGIENITTVGQANTQFKEYLGVDKKTNNPNYIIISAQMEKLTEPWGYFQKSSYLLDKIKSIVK